MEQPGMEQPGMDQEQTESSALASASAPGAARRARRYAFACITCKGRKVKCSGEQPTCAACRRSGDECVWPSASRTKDSQLLHDANQRIRQLEASLQKQASPPQDVPVHSPSLPADATTPRTRRRDSHRPLSNARPRSRAGSRAASGGGSRHGASPAGSSTTAATTGGSGSGSGPGTALWYQVGIGEDGAVVYNGPTSRFHAGTLLEGDDDDEDGTRDNTSSDAGVEQDEERPQNDNQDADRQHARIGLSRSLHMRHIATLKSQHALMQSVWMPLIAAKPMMNGTGVETKTGLALLDIYWTWLHPLHNLVYRPAFLMDLALGGPNVSDFLLLCIFALAARHLAAEAGPGEKAPAAGHDARSRGEQYTAKAKLLLMDEMAAPEPAIPTIQGLLILGGRECAIGRSSQGWLYTGMAIRMMQDIGLHLDTTRLAGLVERWTPAELESRKRLYNAAYLWDKTLSLALGRPPSLTRRPYPSHEIFDNADNEVLWRPVHATEVARSFAPSPAYVTATMNVFCSLHEITTDMLLLFSRSPGVGNLSTEVPDLDARFCRWYEQTPSHLKIDEPSRLQHSPPPHIVSLNLLYHTLRILLRRPLLSAIDSSIRHDNINHCIGHSKKIHAIHTLYTQTFPHRLMTYQVSYCIYTAATVEALELKSDTLSAADREEAAARLTAAVQILRNEASHTPGSGKSLDTIRRILTEGSRERVRSHRHRQLVRNTQRASRRGKTSTGGASMPQESDTRAGEVQNMDVDDAERNNVASLPAGDGTTMGQIPTCSNLGPYIGWQAHNESGDSPWGLAEASAFGHGVDVAAGEFGIYGGTDTGAGFHPDSFSWSIADHLDIPRMPPQQAPLVHPTSSPSSGAAPPTWGQQGWYMTGS